MFLFLTALKHPETANDMRKVESLLEVTLNSLLSQTHEDFLIVVVCNEKPAITCTDPRVNFHVVDYPPVSKVNGKLVNSEKFRDKGTKYMSGLLYAKKFSPDYVFIVDSDDWVNTQLISTLKSLPHFPVWYVNEGAFVNFNTKEYKKRAGLIRYCGSTLIYDYDFLMEEANITEDVDERSSQDELVSASSEFFVEKLLSNHLINFSYFKDKGFEPKPVPLMSSCWIQGTGENVSETAGGSHGLPIDDKFIAQFGLPNSLKSNKSRSFVLEVRDWLSFLKSKRQWKTFLKTGRKTF